MALQPISIGDILMLSQQAWKIGRAFTKGRNSAPAEFAEVEREANGLSEALKLTAESLHDTNTLERAEPETRVAVNTILESAGKTLSDLESFVERYQVIRKKQTQGGFVVERSWSDVFMANYKTIKWTTEGGDIKELRDMLQMHANTISLTMQALQTRSLDRLEKTVMPMAENISSIHSRVNGDMGAKIDDLHEIIMSIANSTPSLVARDRKYSVDQANRESNGSFFTLEHPDDNEPGPSPAAAVPPPRRSSVLPVRQRDREPHDSVQSTPALLSSRYYKDESSYSSGGSIAAAPSDRDSGRIDWDFETGSPPTSIPISSSPSTIRSTLTASTPGSFRRESNVPRRESTTLPNLVHQPIDEEDTTAGSARNSGSHHSKHVSYDGSTSPTLAFIDSYRQSTGQHVLPPPAISSSPADHRSPATPSSFFNNLNRSRSQLSSDSKTQSTSRPPTAKSPKIVDPISPVLSTQAAFEKSLFRNSAILCDVRGKFIEFAQHIPDEPDPRFNTEMVEACTEARICVIRKRENRAHGGTKVATSIWALSTDNTIRLQQKLSDVAETVPYCSYFESEKVSITPTDDEMKLLWHGEKWGDHLQREVKTNWVNYVFASENDAIAFQSAVFGRMLIGTFHTTKTTVIHEGLKGAFAFEEQFANIEMLRLWEDDGVSTPGAQGGILALMHISSNFGEGWARWWINSSKQQVRVKGEGYKYAKLKGIDITVVKPQSSASFADKIRSPTTAGIELTRADTRDSMSMTNVKPSPAQKRIQVKRVTGIKIEFKSEGERTTFVDMSHRAQERMIPLPDV